MKFNRLMRVLGLWCQRGATRRGDYLRKHHVFAGIGENVRYQLRSVPLYPELIRIGNNVVIGSNVSMITHDAIQFMYNKLPNAKVKLPEKVGCIEIGDNVFIGAQTIILGGVRIGSNVIVSAGAYVNKDLEPGGIYGGVPARRIGDFDAFCEKRINTPYSSVAHNQKITREEIDAAWAAFYEARKPAPKD